MLKIGRLSHVGILQKNKIQHTDRQRRIISLIFHYSTDNVCIIIINCLIYIATIRNNAKKCRFTFDIKYSAYINLKNDSNDNYSVAIKETLNSLYIEIHINTLGM